MDMDLAIRVLGKSFNIKNIEQLGIDLSYTKITNNRVKLAKTEDCLNRQRIHNLALASYEQSLFVLSKYGTEEMVERYKRDNRKTYEPSIMSCQAFCFIVDTDKEALKKYVLTKYPKHEAEIDDVTYNGKTYWIADIY